MPDCEYKVAIVTGAAMGWGEAIARELAASGARLVLADIDEDKARALADEFGPDRAKALRINVAEAAEVEALVAFTLKSFGRLDAAVNNAGVGSVTKPTGEYDLDRSEEHTSELQ